MGGRKREGATSLRRRFRSSSGVSMPKAASSSSPISSLPHIRLAFLPVRLRGGVDMSCKDVGTQDGIKGVEGIKKMREGIQKALRGQGVTDQGRERKRCKGAHCWPNLCACGVLKHH